MSIMSRSTLALLIVGCFIAGFVHSAPRMTAYEHARSLRTNENHPRLIKRAAEEIQPNLMEMSPEEMQMKQVPHEIQMRSVPQEMQLRNIPQEMQMQFVNIPQEMHFRQVPQEMQMRQIPQNMELRQYPGGPAPRTIGPIVDKISEGIANGLSSGISTGISSGVTNSIYALPDAISGTVNNLKQQELYGGHYGGGLGGGSYLSPLKGGLSLGGSNGLSLGASGLSHGLSLGSFSKPGAGVYSLSPSYGSPVYSSGLSSGYASSGAAPYFHGKPIIGGFGGSHNVAPAKPFHWDCKLVPAPYGNKLGFKSAAEGMGDVETLSQLIQEAGAHQGIARKAGEELGVVGVPRSMPQSMEQQVMMGDYRNNIVSEVEARKNMALLEEMNMNLPPLGMIDPAKLVDTQAFELMGHSSQVNRFANQAVQRGNEPAETPFMVLLIPSFEMGQQQQHISQHSNPQLAGVPHMILAQGSQPDSQGKIEQPGSAQQHVQQLAQQNQQLHHANQQIQLQNQQLHQQNQQLQHQSHSQKQHRQDQMQSDEPSAVDSKTVETKAKPDNKSLAEGKPVHDELRDAESDNLIDDSETEIQIGA